MKRTAGPRLPAEIRQLNADIAFVGATQRELARHSGISAYDISRLTRGWLQHPAKLARLKRTVAKLKKEVAFA